MQEQTYWTQLKQLAEQECADVLAELPEPVRNKLGELPITFEAKPNPAMQAAGIHADRTLGIFTGVPYPKAVAVSQRIPPQIILFLDNLWHYASHNEAVFTAQVRKTFLHEIGHYLGLDEDGVRVRGL